MGHFYYALVFCAFIAIVTTNGKFLDDHENWPIPSGYTVPWSGHGSYRVYNEAKKWSRAKSKCEEDGAQLAIINSRAEALYVRNLIADARPFIGSAYPGAWIGFRDIDSHRNWRTLNDESLDEAGYTHWWPRSSRGFGMCGTIKTCGRLDAVDCNDSLIIICEYNGPHTIKKNSTLNNCHPCCPPTCCYPVPPNDDPCFSCCKRIPPKCILPPKISRHDICPPDLVPHSGPLPCSACYDCPSTACCPPTFGGSCRNAGCPPPPDPQCPPMCCIPPRPVTRCCPPQPGMSNNSACSPSPPCCKQIPCPQTANQQTACCCPSTPCVMTSIVNHGGFFYIASKKCC